MPIKILAAADLHLGRRSPDLPGDADDASVKRTWRKLVEHATSREVDVLLLAGDIVDQDNKYFEAIGPLQEGFEELGEKGIESYVVAGNHDHDVLPSILGKDRSDKVHLLGANGKWEGELFEKGPEEKLQILGWSFPARYVNADPLAELDPSIIDPNIPSIGILHGDLEQPESQYGPLSTESLLQHASVNGWVLGHIHKGGVQRENPLILYPGSPQALSPKETGLHGIYELSVERNGRIEKEFHPLSPVRYEEVRVDVSGSRNKEELRDLVDRSVSEAAERQLKEGPDIRYLVHDILLEGRSPHRMELGDWLQDLEAFERRISSGATLKVRKMTDRVEPDIEALDDLDEDPSTPLGRLVRTIKAIEEGREDPFLQELRSAWEEKRRDLAGNPTFAPIRDRTRGGQAEVDRYILEECRRLLFNLWDQRNEKQNER